MEYGILFLLILVVICYLQTLMSARENKRFGWILPIVSFLSSFIWLMNVPSEPISPNFFVKVIFTLLLCNTPTYILLLIYHSQRKKLKKKK